MPEYVFALSEVDHVHAMFCAVSTEGISDVVWPVTLRILQVNCEKNVIAAISTKMG